MEEYQISLEDKVRNAFIRRKADFLVKAMNTDEYKAHAKNAKIMLMGLIASAGSEYGKNSYAARDISLALERVEDTVDGDVELQATKWAFDIYSVPKQLEEFNQRVKDILSLEEPATENAEGAETNIGADIKKLNQAFGRYLDAVYNNETMILQMIALIKKKGEKPLEKISETVKEFYPGKAEFLKKEIEFVNVYDAYMLTMQGISDSIAEKEELYASMITDTLQGLISKLYRKADEIEADEVYGA